MVVYDQKFNLNEWYVMIALITGISLMWHFRKGFSAKEIMLYSIFSITLGMIFDHTISMEPFDFYDVNDNSYYQFMDFLTYILYGPFGYLFIYFYKRFKISIRYTPIYILIIALFSFLTEVLADICGVFHYKNGYVIYFSFSIYLIIFSVFICFHRIIDQDYRKIDNN